MRATTLPTTGLVISEDYLDHRSHEEHPERPDRVTAILDRLKAEGLFDSSRAITPRLATDEEILRCHSADYLRIVHEDVAEGLHRLSTGDTPLSPRSLEIARLAAGGLIAAVDDVMAGRVRNAFAVVRPPGHHATPSKGMGFCLFNNISIATRHALVRHGVALVLVSAGFDSRIDDPLGGFKLTDDDFAELTGIVREIAAKHCHGRIISTLEGGYNLAGLASAAASHVRALMA